MRLQQQHGSVRSFTVQPFGLLMCDSNNFLTTEGSNKLRPTLWKQFVAVYVESLLNF